MSKVLVDHLECIAKLKKPGQDIIAELTPEKADMIHMAIGVVTETREFVIAYFSKDKKNMKEEAGDTFFYLNGLRMCFEEGLPEDLELPGSMDVTKLLLQSMNLLEYLKKTYAYGRDPDAQNVLVIIREIKQCIIGICSIQGIDFLSVLQDNTAKLLTGANARYASGQFTNEQANARADKGDETEGNDIGRSSGEPAPDTATADTGADAAGGDDSGQPESPLGKTVSSGPANKAASGNRARASK